MTQKAENIRQLSSVPREHVLRVVEVITQKMWLRTRKKDDTLRDKISYTDFGDGLLIPIDGLLLAAHKLNKKDGITKLFESICYLIKNFPIVGINAHLDDNRLAFLAMPHRVIRDIKAYYPDTFKGE